MTIEEYIASRLDDSVTSDMVVFIRFEGHQSHAYSEYTTDDFSTTIHFHIVKDDHIVHQYGDAERTIYLGESDTIVFLQSMFPDNEEGG